MGTYLVPWHLGLQPNAIQELITSKFLEEGFDLVNLANSPKLKSTLLNLGKGNVFEFKVCDGVLKRNFP